MKLLRMEKDCKGLERMGWERIVKDKKIRIGRYTLSQPCSFARLIGETPVTSF